MTLREKVGQMCQFVGLEHLRMAEKNASPEEIRDGHAQGYYPGYHSTDILRMVETGEASSFFHVVTPEEAISCKDWHEKADSEFRSLSVSTPSMVTVFTAAPQSIRPRSARPRHSTPR